MPTEREVLQQITRDRPEGIQALFDRHAALFHEGLLRFFRSADEGQVDHLRQMMQAMRDSLKAGEFEDLEETFYDWVVRNAWCSFMDIRFQESGGDHLEPNVIYESSDHLNEAALPDEVRERCRVHLEECSLCRELLGHCQDLAVEVRHAGAPYPAEFDAVIAKVVEALG